MNDRNTERIKRKLIQKETRAKKGFGGKIDKLINKYVNVDVYSLAAHRGERKAGRRERNALLM